MSWFEARGGFKCFLAQTASGVSLMVSLAFQVSADSRGCLPGYKLLGVFYATFDCQWCVTTQILPGLSSSVCSHLVCGKCLGKWLRALDLLVHLFLPGNLALQTCRFCVSLLLPFFFFIPIFKFVDGRRICDHCLVVAGRGLPLCQGFCDTKMRTVKVLLSWVYRKRGRCPITWPKQGANYKKLLQWWLRLFIFNDNISTSKRQIKFYW